MCKSVTSVRSVHVQVSVHMQFSDSVTGVCVFKSVAKV
jgi:hypothetical protein